MTGTLVTDSEAAKASEILPSGYLHDYICGTAIPATPEETEAVQVFARRLVDDLGYPKSHIQTRPQYRVRRRPSDSRRSYPVDIAVFSSHEKTENNLLIVVECKKKSRKDGLKQLKLYLTMSDARVGVWFNGEEHLYIQKVYASGGKILFEELPAIPRHGQRVEDIGQYQRKDLKASQALRPLFRDIRNHLAGNLTGITRDEALAQQIIDVLFCKIFDETDKGAEEYVDFRAGAGESPDVIHQRIMDLFASVKSRYNDVFSPTDSIEIDPINMAYVVGELQNYAITEASRDAIGDAFEVFIGPALRGSEGQFFTPRNVVRMMVDILDPKPGEVILDPASGSGGFLIVSLEHIWSYVEKEGKRKGWTEARIAEERRYVASDSIRGVEKDRFLAKVTKSYMAIVGDGRAGIFCENSLLPPKGWDPLMQRSIQPGTADVIVTNPPFGTKIPVKGDDILLQYDLAHRFEKAEVGSGYSFQRTNTLYDSQPPQLLFIERCLQLLKPGGRMGIVLPESIFGMPKYRHVVEYIRRRATIVGVVSMPEDLFQPHTHAKTCVVFVRNKLPPEKHEIFMSIVEWCGHDSRGNPTLRVLADGREVLLDDVPKVAENFKTAMKGIWSR